MRIKRLGSMIFAFALTLSILGAVDSAKAVENFNNQLHSIHSPNSIWVVVNKQRPLTSLKYAPKVLVKPSSFNPARLQLAKPAAVAYILLARAAKTAGAGSLVLHSGYRSYATQKAVHANAVARWGKAAGERLAARPGFSEHQTGLAADVGVPAQGCRIQVCFGKTKGGKWLAKNSWKYGFVIRYPNGETATTGYQYEPWHLRYVGVELSTQMHAQGQTVLEQYWDLDDAPRY